MNLILTLQPSEEIENSHNWFIVVTCAGYGAVQGYKVPFCHTQDIVEGNQLLFSNYYKSQDGICQHVTRETFLLPQHIEHCCAITKSNSLHHGTKAPLVHKCFYIQEGAISGYGPMVEYDVRISAFTAKRSLVCYFYPRSIFQYRVCEFTPLKSPASI